MKKSELKKLIKECILQEGMRQGGKDLGDLSELLKHLDKDDWNNISTTLADDAKLDSKVSKLSLQLYKILSGDL